MNNNKAIILAFAIFIGFKAFALWIKTENKPGKDE